MYVQPSGVGLRSRLVVGSTLGWHPVELQHCCHLEVIVDWEIMQGCGTQRADPSASVTDLTYCGIRLQHW